MSKFKVEFRLKQHTPIIHFQSKQVGATLRATELKPKFDRFIAQQLKNINIEIYDKYKDIIEDEDIFPKDKGSNQYKIFIENSNINLVETPKAYVNKNKETDKSAYQAPYFADASKSIYTPSFINIVIKSFNQELLSLLDAVKDYIFIYENFGARQSKGFGSFMRENISNKEISTILSQHINPVFKLSSYGDYKDAFLTIDNFYKKLKTGINKPYSKSIIFKYMCDNKVGWEKRFIKENFPEVIYGEHEAVECATIPKEFKYIRSMLGLAKHNEFRPNNVKKKVEIKSTNGIERFKSPLVFKIFNKKIYILFDDSYKQIMDEEFNFTLNGKSKKINTPSDFDMYEFLKFVEKKENLIKEL